VSSTGFGKEGTLFLSQPSGDASIPVFETSFGSIGDSLMPGGFMMLRGYLQRLSPKRNKAK
jgi:hypothetical protein